VVTSGRNQKSPRGFNLNPLRETRVPEASTWNYLRAFIDTAKEPKICNTMAVLQRGYIYEKRTRYVKTVFIESHLYSDIQVLYVPVSGVFTGFCTGQTFACRGQQL
jgi:hypothetical protein